MRQFGVALLSVLLVVSTGVSPARGAAESPLIVSGCSVSILGYLSDLAADYEKIMGKRVLVRGGGSVIGLEDLASGRADFAASCRGRIPDDPKDLEFVQVAWDALVFIVHPTNRVESISFADAVAVLDGGLTDWARLGGAGGRIDVFLQRPTKGLSGVESSLRSQVLGGRAPAHGPGVVELASTAIVEQLVEKTPAGFGASGFSSARRRQVKMLALDGARPSKAAIVDRSYPLRRPLYLIVKNPPRVDVQSFVDFARGPRGQELIGSYGAIPLRDIR